MEGSRDTGNLGRHDRSARAVRYARLPASSMMVVVVRPRVGHPADHLGDSLAHPPACVGVRRRPRPRKGAARGSCRDPPSGQSADHSTDARSAPDAGGERGADLVREAAVEAVETPPGDPAALHVTRGNADDDPSIRAQGRRCPRAACSSSARRPRRRQRRTSTSAKRTLRAPSATASARGVSSALRAGTRTRSLGIVDRDVVHGDLEEPAGADSDASAVRDCNLTSVPWRRHRRQRSHPERRIFS